MSIKIPIPAVIPSNKGTALDVTQHAQRIQSGEKKDLPVQTAQALRLVQKAIYDLYSQLSKADTNTFTNLFITAPGGEVIGWIGTYQGYQGGWFKTLYVGGDSPATAPLVADANGDLTITNAIIVLTGTGGTITLDPTVPSIVALEAGASPRPRATLNPGSLLFDNTGTPANTVEIDHNSIQLLNPTTLAELNMGPGEFNIYVPGLPSNLEALAVWGYSPSGRGPFLNFKTASGTIASPAAPASGDSMGGIETQPFTVGNITGRAGFYATENMSSGNNGTEYRISTTPNGSGTMADRWKVANNGDFLPLVDNTYDIGASGTAPALIFASTAVDTPLYRVSGVDGIDKTQTVGVSLNVSTANAVTSTVAGGSTTASFVTSVSLNTATITFSKGIITS